MLETLKKQMKKERKKKRKEERNKGNMGHPSETPAR